ncbi:MAG: tetratricopeptide repeat protein [Alphaproteobacteria bacterium]
MKKNVFLFVACICVLGFCSCHNVRITSEGGEDFYSQDSKYGSYLAARVAHVRKDFDAAAKYYSKTVVLEDDNKDLLSQLYVLYASQGDLASASKYAKELQKKGDKNSFLDTIIAVEEVKDKEYKNVIALLSKSGVPIYDNFINPLILAWAYAGDNNIDMALKEISVLKNEPSLKTLYNFQVAMIYDYFNQVDEAQKYFDTMAVNSKEHLSFRALQLMSNFYLRVGQKEKAVELIKVYQNDSVFAPMLKRLLAGVEKTKKTPQPIVGSPSIGLADSLFSIAATLRAEGQNLDLAHIFVSMAIYSNPEYDLAKLLLADILEDRGMYLEANGLYDSIDEDSDAYDIILRKKADNFAKLGDYKKAEKVLKKIISSEKSGRQLYLSLGDALRMQNKFSEAAKYYKKGISLIKEESSSDWVLYYSLGVVYERDGKLKKAEEMFLKSLDLSRNHYLVQNYLGYMWLDNGMNIDKAFALIVDAYQQAPNDGNILDSLGFAFYKLGFYDKAITYLEEATLVEPNNPVIFEHLGDVYYMAGRKTEAGFLWSQSLSLDVEDEPDFKLESVKDKMKNGLDFVPLKVEDENFVNEKIKELEEF